MMLAKAGLTEGVGIHHGLHGDVVLLADLLAPPIDGEVLVRDGVGGIARVVAEGRDLPVSQPSGGLCSVGGRG